MNGLKKIWSHLLTMKVISMTLTSRRHPMNILFANPQKLMAIATAAFAVNAIAQVSQSTWFEGLLLIALSVVFGLSFFPVAPGIN